MMLQIRAVIGRGAVFQVISSHAIRAGPKFAPSLLLTKGKYLTSSRGRAIQELVLEPLVNSVLNPNRNKLPSSSYCDVDV